MNKLIGTPIQITGQVVDAIMHLPQDKVFEVEITEKKNKRSLDANAYFHLLLTKLSSQLHINMEELKNSYVTGYSEGTFIRIPAEVNPNTFGIKYYKLIGESVGTKKPCNDYLVYKPTHEMNSSEMSNLIGAIVQDCNAVGIETLTPKEIAELKGLEGAYGI